MHLGAKIADQGFAFDTVIDVFEFKDNFTGAGGLFDLHFCAAHHFTPFATFATQAFQSPDTPFIAGASGFDALTDPHFFLRQFFIKLGVLQLFYPQRFFFRYQVLIVIARVRDQFAAIQIHNARRHIANKRTIVGDENDATLESFQKPFQPVDGFNIQVVGRFIKQ